MKVKAILDLSFAEVKNNKNEKIVLIFSSVIGAILSANAIIMMNLMKSNPNFKGNDVVGYAGLVLLFLLIYFGVKNYRNKHFDRVISFGKAFKTGLLIALVGPTIYVFVGLLYMKLFMPDFVDVHASHILSNCTNEAELQAKTAEMANFKEMYKNRLLPF